MTQPQHARIGFYTMQPGTLDAAIARARTQLVPVIEGEPGFCFYTALRTGADSLVSLSGWETAAQAEAADKNLAYWVVRVLGTAVLAIESHLATIASVAEASRASPGYGRVMDLRFQPGKAAEVSGRAQTDFLPLLQQQPGFIRHVALRVGDERTMTFTAFTSAEQLAAAEAATQAWRDEVRAMTTATQRHAGEVVWSARKE